MDNNELFRWAFKELVAKSMNNTPVEPTNPQTDFEARYAQEEDRARLGYWRTTQFYRTIWEPLITRGNFQPREQLDAELTTRIQRAGTDPYRVLADFAQELRIPQMGRMNEESITSVVSADGNGPLWRLIIGTPMFMCPNGSLQLVRRDGLHISTGTDETFWNPKMGDSTYYDLLQTGGRLGEQGPFLAGPGKTRDYSKVIDFLDRYFPLKQK